MKETQYPLEFWLELTKKWWVKLIFILVATLIATLIWFLQPRFGRRIFGGMNELNYIQTEKTSNHKVFLYSNTQGNMYIKCDRKTRNYTIQSPTNEIIDVNFLDCKTYKISNSENYIVSPTENTPPTHSIFYDKDIAFESMAISSAISNDAYLFYSWMVILIANIILFTIAFLFFFHCDRWTYFGFIARPVAVNVFMGFSFFICPFIFAFRF